MKYIKKFIIFFTIFYLGMLVAKFHLIGKARLVIYDYLGPSLIQIKKFIKPEFSKFNKKENLRLKYINQFDGFDRSSEFIILFEILKEKYNVIVTEDAKNYDIIIEGVFGERRLRGDFVADPRLNDNPAAVKIFLTREAYRPDLTQYDLSIGFDYIDDPKYIRIPLYYFYFGNKIRDIDNHRACNPNKPVFSCFLYSNGSDTNTRNSLAFDGVEKRDRLFHQLALYKPVLSGGGHLNNIGGRVALEKTQEWLGECKFVIAYENQSWNGYITEKPFQAYLAGAVPIYYADPSVKADINTEAVIFAPDFKSEDELVEYIKKVDNDDYLYCKIFNEKLLKSPDLDYEVVKDNLRKKLFAVIENKLEK